MPRLTHAILSIAVAVPVLAGQPEEHAPPRDDHAAPRAAALESPPAERGEIGRRIAAASDGDTIEVGPGVYRERLLIDKSITVVGVGRPVLDGGGAGDIVEVTAPGVVFRGFRVRNTGIDLDHENAGIRVLAPGATVEDNILEDILFGIDLRQAPGSVVRGNVVGGKKLDVARRGDGIRLWRADNALVEDNTVHDGRDAIVWYSTGVTIRGNRSYDCRYGFHLMFSDGVTIEENEFARNSVGLYVMYSTGVEVRGNRMIRNRGPSGYGIGFKETDRFTVSGNLIVGNRVGVYLDGSPFTDAKPGEFYGNTLAYNDIGLTFLPSVRGNMLWDNNFIDNIEQVAISGRGELRGNQFWKSEEDESLERGNFWSDYSGYDQDRDGVGDFVHESYTIFENLLDKEPRLRILLFSPAQQAIEFVGRALPAIRPEPKFTDEVPLMAPVAITLRQSAAPARGSLAAVGGGLVGVAGLVFFVGRTGQGPAPSRRARTTEAP